MKSASCSSACSMTARSFGPTEGETDEGLGNIDPFPRGDRPALHDQGSYGRTCGFGGFHHLQFDQSIGEENGVPFCEVCGQSIPFDGETHGFCLMSFHSPAFESHLHALLQPHRPVEGPEPYLRSGGICEDADRTPLFASSARLILLYNSVFSSGEPWE